MPIHPKIRQLQTIALLTTALLFFGKAKAQAQTPETEVRALVDQLFTSMRTGDSTLLRKSFLPDARLRSVTTTAEGKVVAENSGIEGFVKAVGTPHQQIWDERIYNVKIEVDGPIATAWTPYKFYFGEKFSHCGVNAFTLIKTEGGWKIAGITDTRRKEGCL